MLCAIGGLTLPPWVTMCSNCWLPEFAWIATSLLNVLFGFGFSDFQITSPACSPFASIWVVSSRAVTVHSPLGASCSMAFDASVLLAMKSPWRIGSDTLPLATTGPPDAGRSPVHFGSRVVPANSSDCSRQLSPPPGRSIANATECGGSSSLPARSRDRYSTVWAPLPRTVNSVTNGLALAVLLLRVQPPPSIRY